MYAYFVVSDVMYGALVELMADCEVFSMTMRNTWSKAGTPCALTQ